MKQNGKRWLSLFCAAALLVSINAVISSKAAGKGDIDGDGLITAADARLVLRGAVQLEYFSPNSLIFGIADVDGDGALTAADARHILRASVGLTDINTLEELTVPVTASPPPPVPVEETTAPASEPTTRHPIEVVTLPTLPTLPEETTAAPTEPSVPATAQPVDPPAPSVPLSAKGYEIREENGVTYVGGVLIANKTYGLPSDYGPGSLTDETYDAFLEMQQDAWAQGLSLWISSGFRSYSTQESLYYRYASRDGFALADRYSARPGHSEHQTGLAFDLNTIEQSFAYTPEGQWVAANCYKYGFILRYPREKEDVTGYMYEPWHLRYLGVELATDVYFSGLCLEEYLGITSVYQ